MGKVTLKARKLTVILLAAAIMLSALIPAASADFQGNIPTVNRSGLSFAEKAFLSRLDYDKMEGNLKYLADNIGSRFSGTLEEDITVGYLMESLSSYGYQPWTEQFEMLRYPAGSEPTPNYFNNGRIEIGGGSYNFYGPAWAAESKLPFSGKITAAVKKIDWRNIDTELLPEQEGVAGKIAVVSMSAAGSVSAARYRTVYTDAVKKLSAAGAAGIVFVYLKPADNGNTGYSRIAANAVSDLESAVNIPVGCVKYNDAAKFLDSIGEGTSASLSMAVAKYAKNVFAFLPSSTGSKKTVYISCHHDSVISGPGCNDNASGTAMTLEMARAFKSVSFDYNIMFMFFGAEENGLLGAYAYTNKMSAEEKSNFVANYNMDMISTGAEDCNYIFVNISDTRLQALQNQITDVNVALKDNPAAVAIAEENVPYAASVKAAQKLGFPMENYFFCYDTTTDHYAFVVEGRKNSNEYPNMFDAIEYDWRSNRKGTGFELLYHKVGDTPELNYSRTRAESQGDIIALAVYDTAGAERNPELKGIKVGVSQLVAGYGANVPVTVDGARLGDVDVSIVSRDAAKTVYGQAKIGGAGSVTVNIPAAKKIPAGVYDVVASSGESGATAQLTVVAQPEGFWSPRVTREAGKVVVTFSAPFGFNPAKKAVTIGGSSVADEKLTVEGAVLTIGAPAEEGAAVVISGVRFAELFPSYSFTFTLKA